MMATALRTETAMKYACSFLAALTLVALSLTATAAHAQGRTDLVIPAPDGPRHALVLSAGSGPRPTVIVLRGALGTGTGTASTTGFSEAAARHGFTAVFPDGINRQWHDGRAGGPDGPDDVGFIRELVHRLVADGVADPRRVYLAVISNGGMMSFTLVCKAGDLFAGVGTVIANMPAGIEPCAPPPMQVVMVDGTAVTRISWHDCRPATSITLYRVEGGGHALPGRRALLPRILGPSNQDIMSAEVIMDAFVPEPDR